MKKKLLIIIPIFIAIAIGLTVTINQNNNYLVKVSLVDAKSPDRILKVYKDNKKVEFDSIYYLDDVFICDSNSPNIAKSALKNIKKLKVKLKDESVVIAKLEEEK